MKKISDSPQSGMTLIEMLIVVALVGIMMGMAIPAFVRMGRVAKVSNAANSVYTGLLSARSMAMRKQRPIIIKVRVTNGAAANLEFQACLDSDYATVPGANSTAFSCPGGGGDDPLTGTNNPFNPNQVLTLNNTLRNTNNVSLGFPTIGTSVYTAYATNLPLGAAPPGTAGTYWFGFDSSGKLIPDGQTVFAAPNTVQDVTRLTHYPAVAGANPGGPEFYFAELYAASNDANPGRHVYRKVEITNLGGVRVQVWRNNAWSGVQ